MHTHEKNTFSAARITDARHRAIPVSVDDFGSAIDFFREQIVAGAMKIFYPDVFDTGCEKSLHNGIDITGHFQTGAGPLTGHK